MAITYQRDKARTLGVRAVPASGEGPDHKPIIATPADGAESRGGNSWWRERKVRGKVLANELTDRHVG